MGGEFSGVPSYKDINTLRSEPLLKSQLTLVTSLYVLSPNTVTLGVRILICELGEKIQLIRKLLEIIQLEKLQWRI